MLIKILYAILVLSTLALLATAGGLYLRVRRHMAGSKAVEAEPEAQGGAVPGSKG